MRGGKKCWELLEILKVLLRGGWFHGPGTLGRLWSVDKLTGRDLGKMGTELRNCYGPQAE